tara:strand:- start:1380 stop:2393 length:1014 start_codon:yes stop_codon:yes gene_type:complete
MSIIVGKNGELINTSNVGSQLIPRLTPNIGALANVTGSGSVIPRGVKNEDGTITIPTIEMKSRSTGLGRGKLQNVYGLRGRDDNDPGYSQFQFLVPEQTGTMTYDPEADNLMSDTSLANIPTTLPGTGGGPRPPSDPAYNLDLKRAAEKGVGAYGASIGAAMGNAYTGMNLPGSSFTGSDVAEAGFGAILPFGEPTAAETAGFNYMKTGMPTGGPPGTVAPSYGTTAMNRLTDFSEGGMARAGLKSAGFAAGGQFIGELIAGADAMDAAKSAAKTGVAYFIGNAIAGPTGGKVLSFVANLFGPKGSPAPAPVEEVKPETQSASRFDKYGLPIEDGVT